MIRSTKSVGSRFAVLLVSVSIVAGCGEDGLLSAGDGSADDGRPPCQFAETPDDSDSLEAPPYGALTNDVYGIYVVRDLTIRHVGPSPNNPIEHTANFTIDQVLKVTPNLPSLDPGAAVDAYVLTHAWVVERVIASPAPKVVFLSAKDPELPPEYGSGLDVALHDAATVVEDDLRIGDCKGFDRDVGRLAEAVGETEWDTLLAFRESEARSPTRAKIQAEFDRFDIDPSQPAMTVEAQTAAWQALAPEDRSIDEWFLDPAALDLTPVDVYLTLPESLSRRDEHAICAFVTDLGWNTCIPVERAAERHRWLLPLNAAVRIAAWDLNGHLDLDTVFDTFDTPASFRTGSDDRPVLDVVVTEDEAGNYRVTAVD